ncbi:MAG: SDR family NAD(P)-dependent oxidoreductase [Methanotrichaceae archaeon]|nr:SDR family NAD(P)-dependent oxidoreductase [Methanotrichaceae archaeon]
MSAPIVVDCLSHTSLNLMENLRRLCSALRATVIKRSNQKRQKLQRLEDQKTGRKQPMENKVILVTGSTDGIGKQTALGLASMAAQVNLHGRDREKAHAVLEEIRYKTGNNRLGLLIADFSSQKQIVKLAADIKERHDRLHVLINNAGTFMRERKLTEDGIEMTFAVNYMAPFILTSELLGLLKESASSRIINVASVAHWNAKIDWNNLQGERGYDGFQAYCFVKIRHNSLYLHPC